MDPDAALAEIRELVDRIKAADSRHTVQRLAELVDGLDQWLSRGGFLPAAWLATTNPEGST